MTLEEFNKASDEIKLSDGNKFENMKKEFDVIESFITDFFSENCDEIKSVYDKINSGIKDLYKDEKTIPCGLISEGLDIYLDYNGGMSSFINDVRNCGSADYDSYSETFEKAKDKDELFIGSLFNGDLVKQNEIPVSEAIKNLEFLTDFSDSMKGIMEVCEMGNGMVSDENNSDLYKMSVDMMCESVTNYMSSVLNSSINTYNSIKEALESTSGEKPNVGDYVLL